MSQEVDELFGEGAGTPEPRLGLVRALLAGGVALTFVGLACSTVPGGLLVLAAWLVIDTEAERVESGYLPADTRPRVVVHQRATLAGLILVGLMFTAQMLLLMGGFYDVFWGELLRAALAVAGLGAEQVP
ncbi:MAG: hypothetical protein H6732_01630 [Alphaproteobacteria bacterium]|nr:hypothetical protein [Alphaproteobacteria bacterium]